MPALLPNMFCFFLFSAAGGLVSGGRVQMCVDLGCALCSRVHLGNGFCQDEARVPVPPHRTLSRRQQSSSVGCDPRYEIWSVTLATIHTSHSIFTRVSQFPTLKCETTNPHPEPSTQCLDPNPYSPHPELLTLIIQPPTQSPSCQPLNPRIPSIAQPVNAHSQTITLNHPMPRPSSLLPTP